MAFNELNDDKEKLIDDISAKYYAEALAAFREVYRFISARLSDFGTKNGAFASKDSSLEVQIGLNEMFIAAFKEADYQKTVANVLQKVVGIDKFNIDIQKQLSGLAVDKQVVTAGTKQLTANIVDLLFGNSFNANFVGEIQTKLANAIANGASIKDTQALLKQMLLEPPADGKQAKPDFLGFNAVMQYDGGVNQLIADEYKLDGIKYVGSIVKDSRPQCIRWVDLNEFKRSKLPDELTWARRNGKGLIPGTNVTNFFELRGGWNCRHAAYPISLS